MRVALRVNDRERIEQCFAATPDPLEKQQLALLLARQVWLHLAKSSSSKGVTTSQHHRAHARMSKLALQCIVELSAGICRLYTKRPQIVGRTCRA